MMSVPLTLALMFSLGLVVHFLNVGEFWEAAKAFATGGGMFVLLTACLTVKRKAREVGY